MTLLIKQHAAWLPRHDANKARVNVKNTASPTGAAPDASGRVARAASERFCEKGNHRCPGTGTPRWYWLSGRVISLEQDLSAVLTELFQGELCNAGFSDASLIPSPFLSVIPE